MSQQTGHDSPLASPFATLRAEMDRLNTPPWVEKELMQAFAQQFPRKPRWYQVIATPPWSIVGSLVSAALVVLVVALPFPAQQAAGRHDAIALPGHDSAGAFIALDSLERIAQEPAPRLVEAELPRTALATMGLPVTPENAGEPVRAQMLVASDGQPLALRLLPSIDPT